MAKSIPLGSLGRTAFWAELGSDLSPEEMAWIFNIDVFVARKAKKNSQEENFKPVKDYFIALVLLKTIFVNDFAHILTVRIFPGRETSSIISICAVLSFGKRMC